MAYPEQGKAPMVEEGKSADIRLKYYRAALAFLARLKDPLGPKFEELFRHFCEFMDKRTDRQTFYDKASLLLKEHPGLLTDMRKALDSIVGWDQNLRESFLADLTQICTASAPDSSAQSAITVADNKLQAPKTSSEPVATQENVSSGNEHLNRVQEIKFLNAGENWRQQLEQQIMQKRAQQCQQQHSQQQAERKEEPSMSLCLSMHSDMPTVSVPENVLRRNEHPSGEIQEQELPRQEPIPTSTVLIPQRVLKGNVHLSQEVQERELAQQYARQQMQQEHWQLMQQQQQEHWQLMQQQQQEHWKLMQQQQMQQYAQYASQEQKSRGGREHQRLQQLHMQQNQNQWQQQSGNEHLSREIQKQELARQEPNTSFVPVAMQQNVLRGNEHLSQEVLEQELLKRREYQQQQQQQQSGNAPQKPYAGPQRYEQQPRNVPQKPYARQPQNELKKGDTHQQQQQGSRLRQSYVQLQQPYVQQGQMHTQEESDMQDRQRVVQQMYELQQQQPELYRQYILQQQYKQQQVNPSQQSHVQPPAMLQWYMQQSPQPRQQTGQQPAEEQNADRNTSPRTKRD